MTELKDHFTKATLPYYVKLSQILIGLIAFFYILYIGGEIIVPLLFALILAILLNPMVNWFIARRVPKVVAIFLAIILMLCIIGSIFFFIGSQASMFSEAIPTLTAKVADLWQQSIQWFSQRFNISTGQLEEWISSKKEEGLSVVGARVGGTLLSLTSTLVVVFLIPVYIFLFLYYKPLLTEFISNLFKSDRQDTVTSVLTSSKSMVQSYLFGLLIEMFIMAILNATALLIIGIDYALVLAVIGALLNLIPYIGGLVAISLPMLMAFVTDEPVDALYVMISYLVIQMIDNNLIVPMVVASKVKLNALFSIIVVLIGGALWGVAGMFLSIPLTAICKVVFDHVPGLQPFGLVLGEQPTPPKKKKVRKKEG